MADIFQDDPVMPDAGRGLAAYTFVWDLGDVGIALMTVFNMIVLIPMSKEALVSLRDYEAIIKRRRQNRQT